ncbi:MAG: M48 family metalloprotease [Planctomycetes bacterium]|nr:M48 family metalloprotease [Planctomycetota bacterium]
MKKTILRNVLPALIPFAVLGCEMINNILHGNVSGAIGSGTEMVNAAGQKQKEKAARNQDEVNISQEYYIGRGVAANVFQKYKPCKDEKLNRYVRQVGENVAKASRSAEIPDGKQPYKGFFFIVIEDSHVNAFSAPGGFVFITRGALAGMRTEDELACVLGHEIAHIVDRHGVKYILEQRDNAIPFEVIGEVVAERTPGLVGELAKSLAGMCGDLANKAMGGMGEKYENAADRWGTTIAWKAGYDPKAMPEFLNRTHHGEDLK